MVRFKSYNNVVLSMLERLGLSQPQLDTKPGTVARDLFVDAQAWEVGQVYELLQEIASLQSLANLSGDDLTNYGFNFGASRKTGTKSSGQAVFTFRSITSDVSIPAGTIVSTRSGLSFATISGVTVRASDANSLRATATRLREALDTAGLTDQFAIAVTAQAQSIGASGNIASYSITSHNAAGVNGVTNVIAFSGGSDAESDASFRSRILASFAGANTGTSLGYRSLVLSLSDAVDALVVEPGDPLMTRDGTITALDSDGNLVVSEPGTGGRVDIYVMGSNPQAGTDSFIYQDKSGREDPTDALNNFILGQSSLTPDTSLSLNSRRVAALSEGADIPEQPVLSIISVSGSSSGSNFVEEYEDDVGNTHGNYRLEKDTGSAAGSPFGLDRLVWTSDRIALEGESRTKGSFNAVDPLSFTDMIDISAITQDASVTNENSSVSSSSSEYVTLKHAPVRTTSRVFNLTTGERYTIADQNPDGQAGSLNTTGRIRISGRTLPRASDVLQVDYAWVKSFHADVEFDSRDPADELDTSQDSIDWGFPNYIRDEGALAEKDSYGSLFVVTEYPVSRALSVNTFVSETLTVGGTASRKTVVTSRVVTNVHSMTDESKGGAEVYRTAQADGSFSNKLIVLPSDTLADIGDAVLAVYSLNDLLDADGYESGTVLNRTISILPSDAAAAGTPLLVNYVADLENLLPSTELADLPVSSDGYNSFSEAADGYQPFLDLYNGSSVKSNMRRTPSRLKVSASSIPAQGILEFVGTSHVLVSGVYTATAPDTIDLAALIRSTEGLGRNAAVPASISVARVMKLEKVSLAITGDVRSVDAEFDLTNYSLRSNRWDRAGALENASLGRTQVGTADVAANSAISITTGAHIRATFYYAKINASERMFFSKSGTQITDKSFAKLDAINLVSGFADSAGTVSGRIVIDTTTQPEQNATYAVDYDYTAPKQNERITVNFEYNKLIVDATQVVEDSRPITADVLEKQATEVPLDVTAYIIVAPSFETSSETVRQDVASNITAALNATALATTLDKSDVVTNAYNVEGLDRIRITRFNKSASEGTVESVTAQKNEYLAAGTVTVTTEDR
jgi:hypothetical protein